mmetsp:Transcript_27210/g.82451  ORF Transcript_27210/g.82451 Transcript_27210/m.82451 type:complete len:548 (-) Transcript_27210:86-1729(-)
MRSARRTSAATWGAVTLGAVSRTTARPVRNPKFDTSSGENTIEFEVDFARPATALDVGARRDAAGRLAAVAAVADRRVQRRARLRVEGEPHVARVPREGREHREEEAAGGRFEDDGAFGQKWHVREGRAVGRHEDVHGAHHRELARGGGRAPGKGDLRDAQVRQEGAKLGRESGRQAARRVPREDADAAPPGAAEVRGGGEGRVEGRAEVFGVPRVQEVLLRERARAAEVVRTEDRVDDFIRRARAPARVGRERGDARVPADPRGRLHQRRPVAAEGAGRAAVAGAAATPAADVVPRGQDDVVHLGAARVVAPGAPRQRVPEVEASRGRVRYVVLGRLELVLGPEDLPPASPDGGPRHVREFELGRSREEAVARLAPLRGDVLTVLDPIAPAEHVPRSGSPCGLGGRGAREERPVRVREVREPAERPRPRAVAAAAIRVELREEREVLDPAAPALHRIREAPRRRVGRRAAVALVARLEEAAVGRRPGRRRTQGGARGPGADRRSARASEERRPERLEAVPIRRGDVVAERSLEAGGGRACVGESQC